MQATTGFFIMTAGLLVCRNITSCKCVWENHTRKAMWGNVLKGYGEQLWVYKSWRWSSLWAHLRLFPLFSYWTSCFYLSLYCFCAFLVLKMAGHCAPAEPLLKRRVYSLLCHGQGWSSKRVWMSSKAASNFHFCPFWGEGRTFEWG